MTTIKPIHKPSMSKAAEQSRLTHLQAHGSIDLAQFWPEGESDADTSKLLVDLGQRGFTVQRPSDHSARPTQAYDEAFIRGAKKPDGSYAHKLLINSKGQMTVRLQRVDAPELHITPGPLKGKSLSGSPLFKKYRQAQGETATVQLHKHLQPMADGQGKVMCTFDTMLDARKGPGEALDKYGRFVGDLLVGPHQENLNLWLLEHGLAVVALYDSMLGFEIDESLAAWRKGRRAGIRKMYRARFEPFDASSVYRPHGAVQFEGDAKYIHPKYFRRYVTWFAHEGAGNINGSFGDFLVNKAEVVFDLAEFRAWQAVGAKPNSKPKTYPLYDPKVDGPGVGWPPERFIFLEAASTVYTMQGGVERKLVLSDW